MVLAVTVLAADSLLGIGIEEHAPAPATTEQCALLDDPNIVARMDGRLLHLANACGRGAEFLASGRPELASSAEFDPLGSTNVPVSDPLQDSSGTARTQIETAVAFNPITGTICAAWVDSFHGVTEGTGFTGFGRSTDGGATFTDLGALPTITYGDPSLVWRKLNGKFYLSALKATGIGFYRSDTDCASFVEVGYASSTGFEDRGMMAADDTSGSPRNGWIYLAWSNVQAGTIQLSRTANAGAVWSAPVTLPAPAGFVTGAWPAVAPNGDLYVAWLRYGFAVEPIHIDVVKSTDGGSTFVALPSPMTGKVVPAELAASNFCQRQALRGYIGLRPTPTIAVDGAGFVHVVYSYDPDVQYTGDAINVYYRRSTNGGVSWGPEILVNDDGTNTDQWQPSLSVGAGNVVTIGYYSRQLDPVDNTLFDYYSRTSLDGGLTFEPSVRMTDASSPVVLDADLPNCYHGDYDSQTHGGARAHLLWSDDRDPGCADCGANPNIWTRPLAAGTDFALAIPSPGVRVCAPEDAVYAIEVLKFQDFSEAVTLTASDNPTGTSIEFSENGEAPPYGSTLTVGETASAPGTTTTITVTGTSTPSLIEHSGAVDLQIDGAPPASPLLISPPDLTSGLPERPAFSWTAVDGANDYELEIDDDADFSSLEYNETVTTTELVPQAPLPAGVVLYWRVRASNSCGLTDDPAVSRFAIPTKTSYCRSPNLPIPDHQPAGVDDLLTVPGGEVEISDVEIVLDITHTFVGDLSFALSHGGTQRALIDRPGVPATTLGCQENNIDVRVNDEGVDGDIENRCSTNPAGPAIGGDRVGGDPPDPTRLSAFDGLPGSGEWTLHATDHQGGDVGRVNSWCVVLTSGSMPFLDGFELGDTQRWSATVSGP